MEPAVIDPHAILARLGFDTPSAVERVRGGSSMALWRVTYDRHTYALRVLPASVGPRFQYELAAMYRARQGGIPVPRLHAVAMDGARPVMLMDWCSGRTLAAALQAQPWRVWYWGVQFGRMQAAIHALPHGDGVPTWLTWSIGDDHSIANALRTLEQQQQLLHLDYHMLNVLVDDRRITAVLDWTNAHGGDPRADAARTYTLLRVEPMEPSRMRPVYEAIVWVFAQAWRRGYVAAGGAPTIEPVFYAWAGTAMVRDLAYRVGRADSWWQPHHLEAIERWTSRWKRRAGLRSDH